MPEIINQVFIFLIILAGVWIVWQVASWFLQTLSFTPEMFHDFVSQGQPTLVYFFSRKCPLCKHARKAAFYAVLQLDKEAQLLLINTNRSSGRQIAQEYSVTEVPTCLIFNARGACTWSFTGLPDVDDMIEELNRVKDAG